MTPKEHEKTSTQMRMDAAMLVCQARLELATYSLGNCCSIQVSYWHVNLISL